MLWPTCGERLCISLKWGLCYVCYSKSVGHLV
uniref:Uncharacterized protein n=1 Tax=Anguilla anguilla TaxID=7936 RepID=A0A0E9THD7_ANGAN